MGSYNLKVRKYADTTHFEYYSKPIRYNEKKEENKITEVIKKISIIEDLEQDLKKEHSKEVSLNRSKRNLYDIARSNKWDLFITITFDREKVDSSDYLEVAKKITVWLNNIRKRSCPDLKYLIVPEFHKDGIHYHFHGLLANCLGGLDLVDSGHKDYTNKIIYNINNWKFGFTTATFVEDNAKVTNYMGKYISKDMMNRLKYKKRYFASRNCDIAPVEFYNIYPDELYNIVQDPDYIKTMDIPVAGQKIKYFEVKNV